MSHREYLDANLIVRLITQDRPDQAAAVAAYISHARAGRVTLTLTPATLSEVVFVLLGAAYRRTRADVSAVLDAILELPIEIDDRAVVETAASLFRDHHPGWSDCLVSAYALERADGRLLSYDRQLARIPGLARIEPPVVAAS